MRFKAIFIRVIKDLLRDKRSLALMLFAPLLVLTLMYFVFDDSSDQTLKIGVDEHVQDEIVKGLSTDHIHTHTYKSSQPIAQTIQDKQLDAYIQQTENKLQVTYTNEDPSHTTAVKQALGSVLQKNKMQDLVKVVEKMPTPMQQKNTEKEMNIENHYLYGNADSSYFDKMFPILMGFFVFLFVFLISGIALLRERTTGTLERLLATSVKRSEIVFGYLAGYGLFAIVQTLIIVCFSIYLLNIEVTGNIAWVILINIMVAFSALAMGIFVSTFANSEFQMIQFIPIVAIPQVFFSGIIPLDNINEWISAIGYLFPLRYAGNALTEVIIKGQGFEYIWFNLSILLIFIVGFTILNIIGLKRYRKV